MTSPGPTPGSPEQTDGGPVALPADNGAGVPVEGLGTLFRDGTGPIMLCKNAVVTLDLPTSGGVVRPRRCAYHWG